MDQSVPAKVVLIELLEADETLTEAEIHERTLLPEREVAAALSELDRRELIYIHEPRVEGQLRRYTTSIRES